MSETSEVLRAQALGLAKVAYERFVELRIAASSDGRVYLPPWDGAPGIGSFPGADGLPDSEKEIWAQVALAVRAYIPFVITREVVRAAWVRVTDDPDPDETRQCIRAAAEAAGFRVEER